MKTGLPKLHSTSSLFVDLMRASTLDKLHSLFQRGRVTGSENQMQVIRHQDESMQSIGSPVAVVEQFGDDDVSGGMDLEESRTLERLCRDEKGETRSSAMVESCHESESSAAKARSLPGLNVGAKAPTP